MLGSSVVFEMVENLLSKGLAHATHAMEARTAARPGEGIRLMWKPN